MTAGTRTLDPPPASLYEPLVRAALAEDLGLGGDISSEATVPAGRRAVGRLVARASGVLAGIDVAIAAFRLLDPQLSARPGRRDGESLQPGETIATLEGDARALLAAERTALNLLSHLSGIAGATARYVRAVAGTGCTISDTRKTLPGLRALQKYAVRAGGGANHRLRLDDAILIKDNHIALAGGVARAVAAAKLRSGHLLKIEIEVDSVEQLDEVLAQPLRVDAVLLDNFTFPNIREAVRRVDGRLLVEASGGITLENVTEIARAGVDVVSIGALTHSAAALDVAFDIAST